MDIHRVPTRGWWVLLLLISYVFAFRASAADAPANEEKRQSAPVIMGWNEPVMVFPGQIVFRARLDTGARISSIHTTKVREFRRKKARWVEFTIDNGRGASVDLELPVKRYVRIREHGGLYQRRPVVKMGLCLGTLYKETEVNLVDRSGFIYPMLVGRAFMKGDVLVDPAVTKTQEPQCKPELQQGEDRSAAQ